MSTSETKNYFQSLFMPDDQNQQSITNELDTSVPYEQLFSVAGKQITQTRNRLHPDTTRACLCLKSWLEQEIIK